MLPIMAVVVFGTLEACTMLYLHQSMEIAAYESVRLAIHNEAYQRTAGQANVMTNAQVETHANKILAERGVKNATVSINQSNITTVAPGTHITVTITAPTAANSMLPPWFWTASTVSAKATMVKE